MRKKTIDTKIWGQKTSQPGKKILGKKTRSCDKIDKNLSTEKKMEKKNRGLTQETKEKISQSRKQQEKKTNYRRNEQEMPTRGSQIEVVT